MNKNSYLNNIKKKSKIINYSRAASSSDTFFDFLSSLNLACDNQVAMHLSTSFSGVCLNLALLLIISEMLNNISHNHSL